jgi:hypothetical protein
MLSNHKVFYNWCTKALRKKLIVLGSEEQQRAVFVIHRFKTAAEAPTQYLP